MENTLHDNFWRSLFILLQNIFCNCFVCSVELGMRVCVCLRAKFPFWIFERGKGMYDIVSKGKRNEATSAKIYISAIHCDSQTFKANLFILMSAHEQIRFSTMWSLFLSIIYVHFYVWDSALKGERGRGKPNQTKPNLTVSNRSHRHHIKNISLSAYNYKHLWTPANRRSARAHGIWFQIIVWSHCTP